MFKNVKIICNFRLHVQTKKCLKHFLFCLKVCHSSTFQTFSIRSVNSKMICYCGSILANLNITMKTKQKTLKKKRTRIQIETRFSWDYVCGGRIFSRKYSKSSFFTNSIGLDYVQCFFISKGAALFALVIFETGLQKHFLKILCFLINNFW